jgi:hypothetical protein
MKLLWTFAGICPVALGVLFAFAARIDPLSGRLRPHRRRTRRLHDLTTPAGTSNRIGVKQRLTLVPIPPLIATAHTTEAASRDEKG